MQKLFKVLIVFVFIGLIGGAGILGYQHHTLNKAHIALQDQLAKIEKKKKMLQERYKAQKALEANLMRSKRALESKIGELLAEIEKLNEEKQELKENVAGVLKQENDSLREKVTELTQTVGKLRTELKSEKSKFARAEKEYSNKLKQLSTEIKSLETQVTRTNFQFLRCKDHNEKLVDITEVLLLAYEDKGVMGSLLQNEPLTNIKQVQIEKFIQEYQDKIDKEKIE